MTYRDTKVLVRNIILPDTDYRRIIAPNLRVIRKHIRKHGLLSPIIVAARKKGKYQVIDGGARLLGIKSLKFKWCPVRILDTDNIVRARIELNKAGQSCHSLCRNTHN